MLPMGREKNRLGQYFTPVNVAQLMVDMIQGDAAVEILEPSCGEGIFLDVLQENGFLNCTGLEIDSSLKHFSQFPIVHTSFLSWKDKKKFDVIIGNPPYIRWKDLGDDAKKELQGLHHWKILFNSLSDYLVPFIVESVKRLKPGGELIFITPAFWMHTLHSKNLRDWMLKQGRITQIIDFGEARVFKGVATSIVIFRFVLDSIKSEVQYHRYVGPNKIPNHNLDLADSALFCLDTIPSFSIDNHWTLANTSTQERISKLESPFRPRNSDLLFSENFYISLGEYVDIANGMVSGLDKAFRIPEEVLGSLTDDEQNATLKVIKAKDLNRLFSNKITYYIDLPSGLNEESLRLSYPNFYRLLSGYKQELLRRYSYNRPLAYWEWAFKRSEHFFLNQTPKGFVPCKERLTSREFVRFSLAPSGVVATQDVTAFAPKSHVRESIEYIIAYLTLPEVTDWIKNKGLMKGGVAEFSEKPLSMIPFRSIDFDDPDELEAHNQVTVKLREFSTSSFDFANTHEIIRSLLD